MDFHRLPVKLCLIILAVVLSSQVNASRNNKYEFIIQVPYLYEEEIDFEGGAEAEINSDPGFGFAFGYNYSENLAGRISMSWNSTSYDATRVLDDPGNTVESVNGVLDSFSLGLNGDYYLTTGKVSPFVSGAFGWSAIDTNIPAGPPNTVCWWDPWWGYICDTGFPTYTDDFLFYGLGAGLRFDVGRNNFIRAGYYQRWLDIDSADGTPDPATLLFEFGFPIS